MGVLDSLAPVPGKLIDILGTEITLTRTTYGQYDPDTGQRGPDSDTVYPMVAQIGRWQEVVTGPAGVQLVGGLSVKVQPFDVAPQKGDTVTLGGKATRVEEVLPEYIGDVVALYELRCEGL